VRFGIIVSSLTRYMSVPVQNQELYSQCHHVLSGLRWDVVVSFVDIGGIFGQYIKQKVFKEMLEHVVTICSIDNDSI
jgi:hypothetical protein